MSTEEQYIPPWALNVNTIALYGHYKDVFNCDECELLIRDGKAGVRTTSMKDGRVYIPEEDPFDILTGVGKENSSIRESKISFFKTTRPENKPLYTKLTEFLIDVNNSLFNFDILRLQPVQFSSYSSESKGFYGKHTDITPTAAITHARKLSFSVQLSDPSTYEGGELLLWHAKEPVTVPKGIGDMVIFPSYTLH